ncbi:MAG TPA: cytochrome c biogenesis protein CcsA, partial [Acidimicrobiales bacterium]
MTATAPPGTAAGGTSSPSPVPPSPGSTGSTGTTGTAGSTGNGVTAGTAAVAPAHTGSPASRVLGLLALAAVALAALYGLVWSPPDVEMADSVRLMYVHVPAAVFLYVGCAITTASSSLWLWKRTPGWDVLAGAAAEIALVLAVITLGTGSLWGRPTWGTYWTWDARLTSTALLTAMLVGYLALRRLDTDPTARSSRAAILGLLLVPNVMVVHYSVEWWRSLHQRATVTTLDPQIDGDLLVALMCGFLAMGLVFAWLLVHRFRVGWLEHQAERLDLDQALADRRAEAGAPAG